MSLFDLHTIFINIVSISQDVKRVLTDEVYWPAVLSFLFPGLGQIAKKKLGKGYAFALIWLFLVFLFYEKLATYFVTNSLSNGNASTDPLLIVGLIILAVHFFAVIDTINEFNFMDNATKQMEALTTSQS